MVDGCALNQQRVELAMDPDRSAGLSCLILDDAPEQSPTLLGGERIAIPKIGRGGLRTPHPCGPEGASYLGLSHRAPATVNP